LRGRWHWPLWGLAALSIVVAPLPFATPDPAERHLRIEASSFAFSPAVISANPGDRVTLELVANDVVHGLYLDGYDLSVTADPGQTASLTFVADRAGTFRFRCSVTCGALHPFMMGKLQVGANGLFWEVAALSVLAVIAALWSVRR
jgi:heme/copper-type cytochrome/quinol oxidase subunit 2